MRLRSGEAQTQSNRGLAPLTLSQTKNFTKLHMMADVSEEAAKDITSPRQRISEMARFMAS